MLRIEVYRGFWLGREGFGKFVTSSKTGSPVLVLQDEVCFLDWVPCGRQGFIKDRPVMKAMMESNRPSYFLCDRWWVKESWEESVKSSKEHKTVLHML